MAGDAARVADMRGGADRVFALALLASILLHALLLGVLPSGRAPAEQPAPLPLTARLAEEPAPPAPEPVAEVRKPAPPAAPAPVRRAAPKPAPAPVPVPQPVQLPIVAPAAPVAPAAAGPLARVEPLPAPSAAAPDADARELFRANLNAAATRFKRYPRSAIDNNWEGEVVVLMGIGADGRIASLRVRTSSGYEILDRQALDMFRNAKPFVPLPRELRGQEFEVELRAIYSLKDQDSG
jgi:protein TonB